MRKAVMVMFLLAATSAFAQVDVAKVANDAMVVDRVAEAAKRDLPIELLKRIVNEDIELLRGRRANGTYEHARYEKIEAGRVSAGKSIQPRKDDEPEVLEVTAAFAYRLILEVPSRRMLVTRNRALTIDRVDVDYIPQGSTETKRQSFPIEATLAPGELRTVELPEIARQATVKIFARADKEQGYGNLEAKLVQARVVDNPESPYAAAVASAKALVKSLDNNDLPSVRSVAARMRQQLGAAAPMAAAAAAPVPVQTQAARTIEVTAPRESAPQVEIYTELQDIEDLLTGSESERREGMDRLHQLARRMRPR